MRLRLIVTLAGDVSNVVRRRLPRNLKVIPVVSTSQRACFGWEVDLPYWAQHVRMTSRSENRRSTTQRTSRFMPFHPGPFPAVGFLVVFHETRVGCRKTDKH